MIFIKLSNYKPEFDETYYDLPVVEDEPEDEFDKLIRDTANGVDRRDDKEESDFIPATSVERDIEDIKTVNFFLQLSEDNILYVRESDDPRNPGSIITFITGVAMYFTESAEEILMAIAEATGDDQIPKIL